MDRTGKPVAGQTWWPWCADRELPVKGTERLLRGLQDFRVEQFVFSSTMLVHAPSWPRRQIIRQLLNAGFARAT
jgi:hypothetical protein